MPVPKPNEVIIRVHAVAINPADVAVQKFGVVYEDYPLIRGCDAAGEVVELGSEVQSLQKGDRVAICVFKGAFQLYCPVNASFAAELPDHVGYSDACVLGLAMATSTVCMYEKDMLALDYPQVEPAEPNGKVVLIWGGSSALGSCAIQMAKASGYEVAATASKHNFEYCKKLGASYVFDHRSPDVVQDVVDVLKGQDCAGAYNAIIADGVTGKCAQIVDQLQGNKFVSVVYPPGMPIEDEIPDGVKIGQCELTMHYCHCVSHANDLFRLAQLFRQKYGRYGDHQYLAASCPCKWDNEMCA